MTGVAAIAICAAMTSCSSKEELYNPDAINEIKEAKVVEKYNQAFIKVFGQPAADQDWGFEGYANGTRTENANANEWADPTKAYGGLKVPPPLTTEQIAVVKKYFQTHPNLGYEDPKWSNYFIQQVYKGHTSVPEGCATPEQYLAADGHNYIIASDHMDHLIAIDKEKGIVDHINNFNHGDCSSNSNVLTWSPDYVSSANTGPFHTDKIMYMQNSTTKSFAYHNSEGSLYHTEYTGLVSYKTIMQEMGAEANCLEDGWNRSFMGFDFELIVGDGLYAKIGWGDNANDWAYYTYGGQQYHYLNSNLNMYSGDLREYNDLNGVDIAGLLSDGYLPVYNSADKKWVKIGGCADGYFSDWIVTLTEAEPIDVPDPTIVRIIAEDLSAEDATDFDFNDVVFDVEFNADGSVGTVHLVAAGGVFPLTVDGHEVHAAFGHPETDSRGYYKMINTHSAVDGVDGATAAPFPVSNPGKNGRDIEIRVNKFEKLDDGTVVDHWYTLEAKRGVPAAKLCVNQTFQYCGERVPITTPYPNFGGWVRGNKYIWW